ncbi:MAG: glycosyltransferase family 87 protein [Chthoniobacterales bacterium]
MTFNPGVQSSPLAALRARLNGDAGCRALVAFFATVLLVFTVVPILHCIRGHSIKDYIVWYDTGQLVLRGGEIYPPQFHKFPFMYPPSCALFLAPVSALGKTGLITMLVVINAAAWITSILFSVRLATGNRRRADVLLYLIPNLIVVVYVWGNFLLGQPSLLLLALMLGAFIALRSSNNVLAGVLIAGAAAIKAFPVIAIVYLVYRRYWIATISLALALGFLLVALPTPFRGYSRAREDLQRWANGMLFKYDETGVAQRTERSNSWKNQSIWGVANRMLRRVDSNFKYGLHEPVYVNFANLRFSTVNIIVVICGIALGLAFTGAMPRRDQRTPESDAIEFALLLILMLIFTPLSFGYLYAWLLYPFTVITQRLLRHASLLLFSFTVAAMLLLALTIPFRIWAQTYGNTLFASLLLFVALAIELSRLKTTRGTENQSNGISAARASVPLYPV